MKRTKKRTKKQPDTVRTFAAAASQLGNTVAYLKSVRDAGGAGFKSDGRIDCNAVRTWMLANPDKLPPALNWKDGLGEEKLRREKRRNDFEEGELLKVNAMVVAFQRVSTGVKKILRQRLENEYPTFCAGLQVAEARVYGKRLADEIIKEIATLQAAWNGKPE